MKKASLDKASLNEEKTRCSILTKAVLPCSKMLRFVVSPSGQLVFDVYEKLPGRGLWIEADCDQLEIAIAKKAFNRAYRAPVSVPEDLVHQVNLALTHAAINLIALARRAGEAITGADKIIGRLEKHLSLMDEDDKAPINDKDCIIVKDGAKGDLKKKKSGNKKVLNPYFGLHLLASDAGKEGQGNYTKITQFYAKKKIDKMVNFWGYDALTADQLGQAFQKERSVHVLIFKGGLMHKLSDALYRLRHFQGKFERS